MAARKRDGSLAYSDTAEEYELYKDMCETLGIEPESKEIEWAYASTYLYWLDRRGCAILDDFRDALMAGRYRED